MTQTLLASELPGAKYGGKLGFTEHKMIKPLCRNFMMLSGAPGEGKSTLLQSNPDLMIFNLDLAPTTNPQPRATIWPGLDKEGRVIDIDGSYIRAMTYEKVQEKVDLLVEMANEGDDRPDTIAFDSSNEYISLICDKVARDRDKNAFTELDGRRAWPIVADHFVDTCNRLLQHGYGVILVTHLVNEMKQVGDNLYKEKLDLDIPASTWKRIFKRLDMVAAVSLESRTTTKLVEQKPFKKGNKTIRPKPKKVKKRSDVCVFGTDNVAIKGIAKTRVGIPRHIELPLIDGWAYLAKVYAESAVESQRDEEEVPETEEETSED